MLGLGALALFAAMVLSPKGRTTSTTGPGPTTAADAAQSLETQTLQKTKAAKHPDLLPATPPAATSHVKELVHQTEAPAVKAPAVSAQDEQQEARVAARIAQLWDLSAKTDRASLETLLSEVRNPDEEIRQAALDAISQSGNRTAIPGLREVAAQMQDSPDKQAIEDVIEFISLPTLTEILRGPGATNNSTPVPR